MTINQKLNNCADWNDEAGATAWQNGDEDLACRLWTQAKALRKAATQLA